MPNDVLMFRNGGLRIAMGNAGDEVKRQADVVTDSYNDEGFANAVERFILRSDAPAAPRPASGLVFRPSTWMKVTSRPRKPSIARRYGSWKSMPLAGLLSL